MNKNLWNIIDESKQGKIYISSQEQYNNLSNILLNLSKEEQKSIEQEWRNTAAKVINSDEFEKLHIMNGGIINSGDDGFYMDFGNWIISQGECLFNNFKKNGYKSIIEYIKNNNISENDYMFECFAYVFHDLWLEED